MALIEPVDLGAAAPDVVEDVARVIQGLNAEAVPEDPPTPLEAVVNRRRVRRPGTWRAHLLARAPDGTVVGFAGVYWDQSSPKNQEIRWIDLMVDRRHRRHGIGRTLLRGLVRACEGQRDDLVFMTWTSDRLPASEAFGKAIGADPGLVAKTSQLDLRGLDRAQISRWARLDPAGYRLERAAEIPKGLIPAYVAAEAAMNDTPCGTLRMDFTVTEEMIRNREKWLRETGLQRRAVIAVDERTGDGAGYTDVVYDPKEPHVVQQGGTAVVAAHRGHQIGLWMKAAMLDRLLGEWPRAIFVRTSNANVNEHMLAINEKLGFRYAWTSTIWQLPLAQARRV